MTSSFRQTRGFFRSYREPVWHHDILKPPTHTMMAYFSPDRIVASQATSGRTNGKSKAFKMPNKNSEA